MVSIGNSSVGVAKKGVLTLDGAHIVLNKLSAVTLSRSAAISRGKGALLFWRAVLSAVAHMGRLCAAWESAVSQTALF